MFKLSYILPAILLIGTAQANETNVLRKFGFQPLEIYAFEQGTRGLEVADINGDGLDDVLFINNNLSRIEILIRKSKETQTNKQTALEEKFDNRGMIVDQALGALKVADINGDKRLDLITFGSSLGLQIRFQKKDGSFENPKKIFLKDFSRVVSIRVGDLNGDQKPDLLLGRKNSLEILWNDAKQSFTKNKKLTHSSEKAYRSEIADINNDGIADLITSFSDNRIPLRIRYGKGEGTFGVEHPISLPPLQYVQILKRTNTPDQIITILRNHRALRLYGFENKKQPALLDAQEIAPLRIGLEGANKKTIPAWLVSDLNSDGLDDLIVAAPDLSRLHLYTGTQNGLSPEPKHINTLSDVNRLSRFANGDLLVISKKEKLAALHSAKNLDDFPTILKNPGEVLAGCAIATTNTCWLLCKDKDKNLQLAQMNIEKNQTTLYPLTLQNEPSDLLAFQLPNNKTGILLFIPYSSPKMFILENGHLKTIGTASFRALSQPLTFNKITLTKPGDGTTLIVTSDAIARKYQWEKNHYKITKQFNPENARASLADSCTYHLLNGKTGYMIYDNNAQDLIYFSNKKSRKIHLTSLTSRIDAIVQLKNKKQDTFVLLDRSGINEILSKQTTLTPVIRSEYVSTTEDPMLSFLVPVKLSSPPQPMLAVIDMQNQQIELINLKNNQLKKEMAFKIYLLSEFAMSKNKRGGGEPHDIHSGDLNGDGIGDLILLSQDKLLIYLGE